MTYSARRTIGSALQTVLLFVGLMMALALPLATSTVVLAEGTQQCTVQANQCGCATCGCTPDLGRPSCPPGQQLFDDYCLPACPGDFVRYPGVPGLCSPPCQHGCPEGYDQVPLPGCPENYVRDLRNPDQCIPDFDRLRNADNCAPGQSFSSETGRCEVECLEGYYRDGQGQCQFNFDKECRVGYDRDLSTGKCVPQGTWPTTYQWICLPACPQGTVRDIEYPTRCVPPPPTCRDGFTSENGRCLPVCEDGTKRDGYGYCVPQTCPDGTYANLRGQCVDRECPPRTENYLGQCVPVCTQGFERNQNGECEPPDEACPQGTESIRGQCLTPCKDGTFRNDNNECLPPDDACEQGRELVDGQCIAECERGTVRGNDGRCVPTGCQPGFVKFNGKCLARCPAELLRDNSGRCVCAQGTDLLNGKCVARCKQGLVRDNNGRCVCPRGTDRFNGQCLAQCDQGLVRDKSGRCMRPGCGPGTERVFGKCVPVCRGGTDRASNGRCVCPDGTRLRGGQCIKFDLPRQCDQGFRRNENGECVPIRIVPQGCKDGFYFDRRRQRCLPEAVEQQPEEPIIRKRPSLNLDPDLLQQLLRPNRKRQPGANVQEPCPEGTVRDENGRCVKG